MVKPHVRRLTTTTGVFRCATLTYDCGPRPRSFLSQGRRSSRFGFLPAASRSKKNERDGISLVANAGAKRASFGSRFTSGNEGMHFWGEYAPACNSSRFPGWACSLRIRIGKGKSTLIIQAKGRNWRLGSVSDACTMGRRLLVRYSSAASDGMSEKNSMSLERIVAASGITFARVAARP